MAKEEHSADGLGHSLTDLMTSIAVIFILFFLVFAHNQQKEIKAQRDEIEKRERTTTSNRELLLKALTDAFQEREDIEIEEDPDDPLSLEIVIRDKFLSFETDKARVRTAGRRFLKEIIPRLSALVCEEETRQRIDSIVIEGHTDSVGSDDKNTKLGAERATNVLIESRKILLKAEGEPSSSSQGKQPVSLEDCFLNLSQATGRGEQDLVWARDQTKALAQARTGANRGKQNMIEHEQPDGSVLVEDMRESRRVVIKVRVKSVEQRKHVEDALDEAPGD